MMVTEKRCSKCGIVKPISSFRSRKGYKNGISQCKQCESAYTGRYQKTEAGKATSKRYVERHRNEVSARRKRYETSPDGRTRASRYNRSEKGKEYQAAARRRHPNKTKARDATNNAVKKGTLAPASSFMCCWEGCSRPAQEYHHYLGYAPDHWLDVKPYCVQHHRDIDNLCEGEDSLSPSRTTNNQT